jgi:glycoside/pentoside/hexuronide:cation symporter, GPH family
MRARRVFNRILLRPARERPVIFGLSVLVSFFFGSVSVIQWAIYTDAADFGEWKFGRRATGLIMAASLFALKLGLTLGGAAVGLDPRAYGFEAGVAAVGRDDDRHSTPDELLPGRLRHRRWSLIMFLYPLNDKMMVTIEEDLTARRGEAA